MSYQSPIEVYISQLRFDTERQIEDGVIRAVRNLDIAVEKNELIKALKYDRGQYDKGYTDGYHADKWVNCADRLPDDGELVLVWFEYSATRPCYSLHQTVGTGYHFNGKWIFVNGTSNWRDLKVYAWQPLPERPTKFAIIKKQED